MLTYEKLEKKLNKSAKIVIVTTVLLPSLAVETLVNYHELEEKADYLLNAYDKNLCLKTFDKIKLLDVIVISNDDINKIK